MLSPSWQGAPVPPLELVPLLKGIGAGSVGRLVASMPRNSYGIYLPGIGMLSRFLPLELGEFGSIEHKSLKIGFWKPLTVVH